MNYDVIGDIHGQADKLEALLQQLGYAQRGKQWTPPKGHQAVFVGDLIDRGPAQERTVDIVRRMVDAGHARCVLGNHEVNAMAYAVQRKDGSGKYLRDHSEKNVKQHAEYLRQVGEGSRLHREHLSWFRTLPPALDLGAIRVVHAWWNAAYVDLVHARTGGRPLDDAFLHAACTRGTPEWEAMEGLTKGQEVELPAGRTFRDHEGVVREHARTRWWLDQPRSYADYLFVDDADSGLRDEPVPPHERGRAVEGSPVFIGHYWLKGTPSIQAERVVCVDYSAAKDGPLVCYRWQGEESLRKEAFVLAGA